MSAIPDVDREAAAPARSSVLADLRAIARELADYRELLFALTRRDLLLRYRHTIMGFGWALLMPVTYMVVFSMIFTRVGRVETGVPYPLFAYTGLLPWSFLASTLRFSVGSLIANRTLITKVYFPREILPLSAMLTTLVDFAAGATVLAALMAVYHVPPHATLVLVPVVLLVQVAFTAGMALLVSLANLFFRDVKYLIEILITLWMLASSVVYPVERVGGRLGELLALNPVTPILDAWRAVVLRGEAPAAGPFAYAAGFSVLLLVVGAVAFHRAEPRFAETL